MVTRAKKWVIMRQETFNMTYVIESEEEITEEEAKRWLFDDGPDVGDLFDRSWLDDNPIEEWETLAVPKDKTFGLRSMTRPPGYELYLDDPEEATA